MEVRILNGSKLEVVLCLGSERTNPFMQYKLGAETIRHEPGEMSFEFSTDTQIEIDTITVDPNNSRHDVVWANSMVILQKDGEVEMTFRRAGGLAVHQVSEVLGVFLNSL